jgi:hypothetical protein
VWAVDRSHDDAQRSIQRVCAIHKRGLSSVIHRKLRSRVQRIKGTDVVLPKSYQVAPDGQQPLAQLETAWDQPSGDSVAHAGRGGDGGSPQLIPLDVAAAAGAEPAEGSEQTTVRYPPAVEQEDAYNLVKFYTLERSLVFSILAATFTEKLEFPFLPDETEHLIISLSERRSVLLIGRSGTGKTTIVVQRMWLKFRERLEAIMLCDSRSHTEAAAAAVVAAEAAERRSNTARLSSGSDVPLD